ncbi:MAG: hypothetical protein QXS21_03855 [Thermoproteota archaeon]|nr:hypothetical protein [Candidatus Brockarchaeota archaeon]MBO3802223.1 hypothetical protein [Candidatus Brockarchaeota archaeon]
MSEEYSTIRVSRETKKKLDKMKVHPREPYEDVIKRLMKNANNLQVQALPQ